MKQDTTDPLMLNDPWKAALSQAKAAPMIQQGGRTELQELESRVERSILAKLPAEKMETDDHSDRLRMLETQFQQLASRQQSLEQVVSDNHSQSTAQVQSLQAQMVAQMEVQGTQLQSMFEHQMARIEAMMSPKQE